MHRALKNEVFVNAPGRLPVTRATVADVVALVLDGEAETAARVSVTFTSSQQMRALNRKTFGRDHSTDVIAFPMRHDDRLIGDVYVCEARARAAARQHSVSPGEEIIRLVVHGTLHLLGYDHGPGEGRVRSSMWKLQERYVDQCRKMTK